MKQLIKIALSPSSPTPPSPLSKIIHGPLSIYSKKHLPRSPCWLLELLLFMRSARAPSLCREHRDFPAKLFSRRSDRSLSRDPYCDSLFPETGRGKRGEEIERERERWDIDKERERERKRERGSEENGKNVDHRSTLPSASLGERRGLVYESSKGDRMRVPSARARRFKSKRRMIFSDCKTWKRCGFHPRGLHECFWFYTKGVTTP